TVSGVRSFESDLAPKSDTVSGVCGFGSDSAPESDSVLGVYSFGSDLEPESDTISRIRSFGSNLAPESDTISRICGSGSDLAPESDTISRIRGFLSDLTKTIRLSPILEQCKHVFPVQCLCSHSRTAVFIRRCPHSCATLLNLKFAVVRRCRARTTPSLPHAHSPRTAPRAPPPSHSLASSPRRPRAQRAP